MIVTVRDAYDIVMQKAFEQSEDAEIFIENCIAYGFQVNYIESTLDFPLDRPYNI